jgi:hypothetical protein
MRIDIAGKEREVSYRVTTDSHTYLAIGPVNVYGNVVEFRGVHRGSIWNGNWPEPQDITVVGGQVILEEV